jgi:hypothetical protein
MTLWEKKMWHLSEHPDLSGSQYNQNNKLIISLFLLLFMCLSSRPAEAKYGGGTGEPNNPYLIYTAEQMNTIGLNQEDWDKHFKLMEDIDLKAYTGTTFHIIDNFSGVFDGNRHVISNFNYTGSSVSGLFVNTNGAEIKNLGLIDPNINKAGRGLLVCWLKDSKVTNCYVKGGNISGNYMIGGLIGDNDNSTIMNSYSQGNVSGSSLIGGLVGRNRGTIINCYFSGAVFGTGSEVGGLIGNNSRMINNCYAFAKVSGTKQVGGLVGAHMGGKIIDCYATGSVRADEVVGGFVGGNNGVIITCYSTSDVSGNIYVGGFNGQNGFNLGDVISTGYINSCYARGRVVGDENIGGLVGYNYSYGTIKNCYATGSVSGTTQIGGLVGKNSLGKVINSFWDIKTSGQKVSEGGIGKTTAEMKNLKVFMSAGWDFVLQSDGPNDTWDQPKGGGYPVLWWQVSPLHSLPKFSGGTGEPNNPYLIAKAEDLNRIGHNPRLMKAEFKLIDDINLRNVKFYLIGGDFPFSGIFDGNGKQILNFNCSDPGEDYIGLFISVSGEIKDLQLVNPNVNCSKSDCVGVLAAASSGIIRRCKVSEGRVRGNNRVAMLIGENSGMIVQCYTTGTVIGYENVGGLVARNNLGTITDCGTKTNVSGTRTVGGLVGNNSGFVTKCYATGEVMGKSEIGGLIGVGVRGAENLSYWDIETSKQKNSAGGTGKTTSEMQTAGTFLNAGWDFIGETKNGTQNIWWIDEGKDCPRLWWEATVTYR